MNTLLDGLKQVGLFFMRNIPAILFLVGLSFIVYSVFLFNAKLGYLSIGACLVLIALILVKESQGR